MGYTRADWSNHYAAGKGFRRLGDKEKDLLAEHAPAPRGRPGAGRRLRHR
ncbi:hypothetical protein [Streptomyces sp. RKCA744]|nr:hypothetical protein [Streptomyces sp. RKCA744]MCO8301582.1 hypothetical protein [Streptomyces sp. RKCA744]